MSLALTKLPRPIFFWKLSLIGHCKLSSFLYKKIFANYALANGLTLASVQNTSFLHILHKVITKTLKNNLFLLVSLVINTIVCVCVTSLVCLITCPNSQIFKWNKTLIITMKFEICIMCKSHLLWFGGTEGSVASEYDSADSCRLKWCRKPQNVGTTYVVVEDGVMKKGSNECEYMGWVMDLSW